MGLDLSLDSGASPLAEWTPPAPAAAKDPRAITADDLLRAHEVLLRRIDEVRSLAERLEGRVKEVRVLLSPTETARLQQTEAQERALQQAFAGVEKHWAETAARYRTLADDLSRRMARDRTIVPFARLKAAAVGLLIGTALGAALVSWPTRRPLITAAVPLLTGQQPQAAAAQPATQNRTRLHAH
jgi:hypothetical protein